MAEEICLNAKCSRPSVCNAMETLLVHREVAAVITDFARSAADTVPAVPAGQTA